MREARTQEGIGPEVPRRIARRAPRITVCGDALLDVWIHGTSGRLAREAPAPVVDAHRTERAPGGAANTAMNLAALGARVRMVGLVGDDAAAAHRRRRLDEAGVDTSLLLRRAGATTAKTRIVVEDQVMVRLDRTGEAEPAEALARLTDAATAGIADADALVVCDYGGAVHTAGLPERLAGLARPPLVVVDAHRPDHWAPLRPDLVTPNAAEAEAVLGSPLGHGRGRVEAAVRGSARLCARTGAAAAVVTLDRDGAVLADGSGALHRTRANPAAEKQASGAGDTFVAALTAALASGVPRTVALDLAQAAADVVVQRLGTSLCSTEDLLSHLGLVRDALTPVDALVRIVDEHRAAGRRIVLTNGCFDVLHRGHTASLSRARRLGDVLVVALNDDASVRRLKGPDRPLNPLPDRAGVLAALSCVDHVVAFSEDAPLPLISALRPDVYAKGGDYAPEMLAETAAVEACGGEVRILDYVSDYSTSSLVERMRTGAAHAGA